MTAKADAEQLLNEVLPFAKRMLAEFGEFHPFGGMLTSAGEVVQVGADVGQESPSGQELVDAMTQMFREKAAGGDLSAAALVLNVSVTAPDAEEPTDAIEVRIDHRDGYAVHVFYPYALSDNELTVSRPFASQGVAFAFAD